MLLGRAAQNLRFAFKFKKVKTDMFEDFFFFFEMASSLAGPKAAALFSHG